MGDAIIQICGRLNLFFDSVPGIQIGCPNYVIIYMNKMLTYPKKEEDYQEISGNW